MIPRRKEYIYNIYRTTVTKLDGSLDDILPYIPTKNGKRRDGVFIKDGKIILSYIQTTHPIWAIIDPLLGKTKDDDLAWFFAIPTPIIKARRSALGIKIIDNIQYDKLDPLIEYGTDEEISELLNGEISPYLVRMRREFLKEFETYI